MAKASTDAKVIDDFGEQWTQFRHNRGYYASLDLLVDLLGPLIDPTEFRDKVIAEVGSGTGRIINMLAQTAPKRLIAIEPSAAIEPLRENTSNAPCSIEYLNVRGDEWAYPDLDFVVSFGVLHHIPDPTSTVRTVFENLKPGGKAIVWLYGREGNELYLRFVGPLRSVTTNLPHALLMALVWILYLPLKVYIGLCRFLPLPMRKYMRDHLQRLDGPAQRLTIYDQLNPAWAKYYTREQAEELLRAGGFVDVRSVHRHGYSWTVVGTKPPV